MATKKTVKKEDKFSTNKFAKKMKAQNLDLDIPPVQDWKVKKTFTLLDWLQERPELTRLEMYIGMFIGMLSGQIIYALISN